MVSYSSRCLDPAARRRLFKHKEDYILPARNPPCLPSHTEQKLVLTVTTRKGEPSLPHSQDLGLTNPQLRDASSWQLASAELPGTRLQPESTAALWWQRGGSGTQVPQVPALWEGPSNSGLFGPALSVPGQLGTLPSVTEQGAGVSWGNEQLDQ